MAKISQFGGVPGALPGGGRDCLPFEAMLADAIDGTLSAEEQARFDEHLATCDQCPDMLSSAQEGRALLEMLRPEVLEPSPALLARIFDQTTAQRAREQEAARAQRRAAQEADSLLGRPLATLPVAVAVSGAPAGSVVESGLGTGLGKVLPFRARLEQRLRSARHTVFQPRFAMTAAMAFFSIALTLNLSGVHVSQMRMSDLRPGNVKRGVYEARARVVRYYANLRVVYELESRVHDLQRSDDNNGRSAPASQYNAQPSTQPGGQPGEQKQPAGGSGAGSPAEDKGKDAAPPSATPGRGKSQNPAGKTSDEPRNSRNRPNGGTSHCLWPVPPLQEVRFEVLPAEGSSRPLVAVQSQTISEPQGKRGLA